MSHYAGTAEVAIELTSPITPNPALGLFAISQMPDIYLGRDRGVETYKYMNFHEMAHASHYLKAGLFWWNKLTTYEVYQIEMNLNDSDPYGDGTFPDAGYCAVAESWAEHIGASFSNFIVEDLDQLYLENGFIPRGLYWDLYDIANENWLVSDNIGGFNNSMFFEELNSRRIEEFRNRLWDDYGSNLNISGTLIDYTDLFMSYGY